MNKGIWFTLIGIAIAAVGAFAAIALLAKRHGDDCDYDEYGYDDMMDDDFACDESCGCTAGEEEAEDEKIVPSAAQTINSAESTDPEETLDGFDFEDEDSEK